MERRALKGGGKARKQKNFEASLDSCNTVELFGQCCAEHMFWVNVRLVSRRACYRWAFVGCIILAVSLLWLGIFRFFSQKPMVWQLQLLAWLGIFWLLGVTYISGKIKMFHTKSCGKYPTVPWKFARWTHRASTPLLWLLVLEKSWHLRRRVSHWQRAIQC